MFITSSFDPFRDRIHQLDCRLRALRAHTTRLQLLTAQEVFDNLDPDRKEALTELVGIRDAGEGKLVNFLAESRVRLQPVRTAVAAIAVYLRDIETQVETAIARIRKLAGQSDYNETLKTIIQVEQILDYTEHQNLSQIDALLTARSSGEFRTSLILLDTVCTQLFERVLARIVEERLTSSDLGILPPVVVPTAGGFFRSPELSGRDGALPCSFVPISYREMDLPWNAIRGLRSIVKSLLVEFPVFPEITQRIQYLASAQRWSPIATQLFTTWQLELLCDAVCTMIAGPVFVSSRIELDTGSADTVYPLTAQVPGLSPYVHWSAMIATLGEGGFIDESAVLQRCVETFYGPNEFAAAYDRSGGLSAELLARMPSVVELLCQTPLVSLGHESFFDLVPLFDRDAQRQVERSALDLLGRCGVPGDPIAQPFTTVSGNGNTDGTTAKIKRGARVTGKRVAEGTSLSAVRLLCSARLAFEKLSSTDELPSAFGRICRETIESGLISDVSSADSRDVRRDISEEELRRLIRRRITARSIGLTGPEVPFAM